MAKKPISTAFEDPIFPASDGSSDASFEGDKPTYLKGPGFEGQKLVIGFGLKDFTQEPGD
jgi:hypothetical protein